MPDAVPPTVPDEPPSSVRERARQHVRDEIAAIAIDMFLARGYDATTAEDIVAVAGVSRATFFRHFAAKEETVLGVFTRLAGQGCRRIVAAPAHTGLWPAILESTGPFVAWLETDPARALAVLRLVFDTPALRASFLDRLDRWRHHLEAVLAERVPDDTDAVRVPVLAGAGIALLNVAIQSWVSEDGRFDVKSLLVQSFTALSPAGEPR
ncbi:TetR/AcrR family transcriptional regulator [Mycolicibacterium sp.]|uniref:TetR/AcrR family transcriptional regulator n=1 Tax=Mycolicibacterium sp. TaxID=2320850 RepID=UPI003D11DA1A